jgi:hypothetical protein
VAASVEELAFDLAFESLSAQRDVLRDVRARSATLLTGCISAVDPLDASVEDAYVALADEIRAVRQRNRPLINRAFWSLRLGFVALVLEVILFLAALAVH